MAEGALDKKRVYDPTREKPKSGFRITRRGLLQAGAVLIPGTVLGVLGYAAISSSESASPAGKTTLEILLEKGIVPKEVYVGDIKITKGKDGVMLFVRSATNTTQESSTTDWLNIEKWNGVNIQYVNEFLIKNCLFVAGAYADNPTGTKGEKGLWIVGNVGTNVLGVKNESPKFISKSSSSSLLVTTLGGEFHKISEFNKEGITMDNGQKISKNQIGLVTPLTKTT